MKPSVPRSRHFACAMYLTVVIALSVAFSAFAGLFGEPPPPTPVFSFRPRCANGTSPAARSLFIPEVDEEPPPRQWNQQDATKRTSLHHVDAPPPSRPLHDAGRMQRPSLVDDGNSVLVHLHRNITLEQLVPGSPAFYPAAFCELYIIGNEHCFVEEGQETYVDCVRRFGARAFGDVLPTACTRSPFWRSLADSLVGSPPTHTADLRDLVWKSIFRVNRSFVSPDRWTTIRPWNAQRDDPSRDCACGGERISLYPISLTIPETNFFRKPPPRVKVWDFAPFLPGIFRPRYKYFFWPIVQPRGFSPLDGEEYLLKLVYRFSYFAFTHFRGGPDCARHTEQLATGVLPYFADIERATHGYLALYPVPLLKQVLELPGVAHIGSGAAADVDNRYMVRVNNEQWFNYRRTGDIDWNVFDKERYHRLARSVWDHARTHLTCGAAMSYVLRTVKVERPRNVLVLQSCFYDYLAIAVEAGLDELGVRYTKLCDPDLDSHRWTRPVHGPATRAAFEDYDLRATFLFAKRINPAPGGTINRISDAVLNDMRCGVYDLIFYARLAADEPAVISEALKSPSSVVLFDGGDFPQPCHKYKDYVKAGAKLFIRESGLDRLPPDEVLTCKDSASSVRVG